MPAYIKKSTQRLDPNAAAYLDEMRQRGWFLTKVTNAMGDEIPAFGMGKYKNGARFIPPPVGVAWMAVDGWKLADGNPRELLINEANVISFRLNAALADVEPIRGQFLLAHDAFLSFIAQFGLSSAADVIAADNIGKASAFAENHEFALDELAEKLKRQLGGVASDIFHRVIVIPTQHVLVVKSLEHGLGFKLKYDLEGWAFVR